MAEKPLNVDTAYALQTPEDSRRLYAKWAKSYDADFAEANAFLLPAHVARIFNENRGAGPVLDAGAGTGLVAAELQKTGVIEIDGVDISSEMLAVARGKGHYRKTILADLTKRLPVDDGIYNAVTSSGTFTHGHVGPEAIDELLRVAAPGALFVLTIKTDHYEARGFAKKFAELEKRITGFSIVTVPVYANPLDASHAEDQCVIATFRKA